MGASPPTACRLPPTARMFRYLLARLALVIPVMVGVSVLIFALLRFLPCDIVDIIIGSEGSATPEVRETIRRLFGLDQPGYVQYLRWLGTLLRGDLGSSLRSSEPVAKLLFQRLPITMELAGLSVLLSVVMRMTRSAMLEVLGQEYIKTARAKGLADRLVLARHALKTAMIPVITVVGIQMGQ